ncbi:MAG: hypothetical protein JW882_07620 [Deltaproteobacteria bacterium]|nr:hypothetical protein [Deltaproteobacteria bacterium]
MKQYLITPASGKRLIGRAVASDPAVLQALESGTVAIIAGTTNGYVAEEILKLTDQKKGFSRKGFFRGITLPPAQPTTETGRLQDERKFPGDVIIVNGIWRKGKTIFDIVDNLKRGDVVLKGANALDIAQKRAAILIGDPKAGTIGVILQAVAGRRVRLIIPVGLEKRVAVDLDMLANTLNHPDAQGPRLLPVSGQIVTEIDAIKFLTGADVELVAGGGVGGAEGSVWVAISGNKKQMKEAEGIMSSVSKEPMFQF